MHMQNFITLNSKGFGGRCIKFMHLFIKKRLEDGYCKDLQYWHGNCFLINVIVYPMGETNKTKYGTCCA